MKGRGAVSNIQNRFLKEEFTKEISWAIDAFEEPEKIDTKVIEVHPKTMINEVKSEDLSFMYSMNPYQGCEHGCAYCYARPTHEYWGYSAGMDFESIILVKKNAVEVLDKELRKINRIIKPIVISGNTDCYQPIEKKYRMTRQLLQTCLEFQHPISIITKNALILRDMDILILMAQKNLISVMISVTSTDEKLRSVLEPRTSTYANRFKTIKTLSEHQVPCGVMVEPVIPGINDTQIPEVLKNASENGAKTASFTIVRLNDTLAPVFTQWLEKTFSDKKQKVLSLIKSCHQGNFYDKRSKLRFSGDGKVANSIHQLFKICYQKYFKEDNIFVHNYSLFTGKKTGEFIQGSLF